MGIDEANNLSEKEKRIMWAEERPESLDSKGV